MLRTDSAASTSRSEKPIDLVSYENFLPTWELDIKTESFFFCCHRRRTTRTHSDNDNDDGRRCCRTHSLCVFCHLAPALFAFYIWVFVCAWIRTNGSRDTLCVFYWRKNNRRRREKRVQETACVYRHRMKDNKNICSKQTQTHVAFSQHQMPHIGFMENYNV